MPYRISQCYLPPTEVTFSPLPQQKWYWIKRPRRDAKLSWPSWLITYWDGIPARRRSPIQVLTGPHVCVLTSFMRRTPLTTTLRRQPVSVFVNLLWEWWGIMVVNYSLDIHCMKLLPHGWGITRPWCGLSPPFLWPLVPKLVCCNNCERVARLVYLLMSWCTVAASSVVSDIHTVHKFI